MKKIKAYLVQMYFGKTLPFDYRIYMIFFFECLAISVISATTNTLLQKGIFGIVFQWAFIAFCIVVLFIPIGRRMAIAKPLLVFVAFIYIPFLFFQTAGYNGTAGLFSLLAGFLLTILFNGKARVALVVSNIALWVVICTLQYLHPQIVIRHGSELAKFLDYIVALILGISGIAILGTYITSIFEGEQTRVHRLLRNEEKANKKLEDLTNRDPLTGTYNRRFLTNFLESELKYGSRGRQLCVMLLDIDHFKQINDTWGHGFGDEALVRIVSTIQDILRKDDILARTGGEEFVIVLNHAHLPEAKEIAERIRKTVEETKFSNNARITVSIGLAEAKAGEGTDSLLNRADKYLYAAKNAGRNRVVNEK